MEKQASERAQRVVDIQYTSAELRAAQVIALSNLAIAEALNNVAGALLEIDKTFQVKHSR